MARTPSNSEPDNLPAPATHDRPYLQIQPATTPLDPDQVAAQARNLHGLDTGTDERLLARLRGSPAPTVECLLVTDHTPTIEYYVGIDPPDAMDALRTVLRRALPASYEVTRTDWHPEHLSRAGEAVATVEYLGDPDRPKDHYTQLTPFAEFTTDEQATVPLATIAEAMADSDVPMVYQALLQPLPDQTVDAEIREREIEAGTDTVGGKLAEVVPYYELKEGSVSAAAFMGGDEDAVAAETEDFEHRRLDVVGLDDAGGIVVTVEAERINNDVKRAVPEDFDKMAACEPEEAIWLVMTRSDGCRPGCAERPARG